MHGEKGALNAAISCMQTIDCWFDGINISSVDKRYALYALLKIPVYSLLIGNREGDGIYIYEMAEQQAEMDLELLSFHFMVKTFPKVLKYRKDTSLEIREWDTVWIRNLHLTAAGNGWTLCCTPGNMPATAWTAASVRDIQP